MTVIAAAAAATTAARPASTTAPAPVEFAAFEYRGTETPAGEPAHDQFRNPILSGFHPDPSICRAGDDYFMVCSTFAWYPGVPIFRSRDLVNWTLVGHVLDRPSQLNLDKRGVSEGIFAPTIRHHRGVFYVVTTLVGDGGNFYVTATDPAGSWSEPKWLRLVDGIDPSLFFDDDGSAYLVHNGPPPDNKPLYSGHRALWLHQFDLKTGDTVPGSAKPIVNGGIDLADEPVWIEAPHLFKRGGHYYLFAAEGGTGPDHREVVFRSRNISGPYEPLAQPVLTQRHLPATRPNPVTCTGHADFVEGPAGEWWGVFLGCRPYRGVGGMTNIGRETFLLPMRWGDDGWPTMLSNDEAVPRFSKRPHLPPEPPSETPHNGNFTWHDDFDSTTLSPVWNFLRTPRQRWYSLELKPGSLLIEPRPVDLNSRENPSLIARRQQHAHFAAGAALSVGEDPRVEAGIVAFQNEAHYFFLGVRSDSPGAGEIFLERAAGKRSAGRAELIARAALPQLPSVIELEIAGDARDYSFNFRAAGHRDWTCLAKDVDGSILSTDAAGGFVGSYLGMFARLRPTPP